MRRSFSAVARLFGSFGRAPRALKDKSHGAGETRTMTDALGYHCASRTHVGLRRVLNEDAVLVRSGDGIWAVSDGMGGHHAGDVASAMVVEVLSQCPVGHKIEDTVASAIALLVQANERLIEMAAGGSRRLTIGATVVGLAADRDRFYCFWAGDSRAYHLRGQTLRQLTHDHSLVQDLVDAGMLEVTEAEHHPNANVITRAVGAQDHLAIDTVAGDLRPGDRILLASDGLTRQVDQDELLAHLCSGSVDQSADRLLALALDRGGTDNISLVIVQVQQTAA